MIGVQVAAEILAITANLRIVYYIPGIVISTWHSLIHLICTASQLDCANMIPILQIRKPICRKMEPLTQGHKAIKCQR